MRALHLDPTPTLEPNWDMLLRSELHKVRKVKIVSLGFAVSPQSQPDLAATIHPTLVFLEFLLKALPDLQQAKIICRPVVPGRDILGRYSSFAHILYCVQFNRAFKERRFLAQSQEFQPYAARMLMSPQVQNEVSNFWRRFN